MLVYLVRLKPQSEVGAQVVVQGRVLGNARARDYQALKAKLLPAVLDSFARLSVGADLVLVEGYKRDRHPKIEAFRAETGNPLIASDDPTIRAVASDTPLTIDRPLFDLDDTKAIADFILAEVGL